MSNRIVIITIVLLSLASCAGDKKIPVEGLREPILSSDDGIRTSVQVAYLEVKLPSFIENKNWPQVGGEPDSVMPPVALGTDLKQIWKRSIGVGSSVDRKLLSTPVVYDGVIYAIDGYLKVSAIDIENGKVLWQKSVKPKNVSGPILGGGIAYDGGYIYITSPFAEVISLDARNGNVFWQTKVDTPMRSSPIVKDGRLFTISIDSKLFVLDASSGEQLWSHVGIVESASILGGASVSLDAGVVIVPYSSGEIFALRVENGHSLWSESVTSFDRLDSVSSLVHIKAQPVIDNGLVFFVSHGGNTSALDLRTGNQIWSHYVGGINTPVVAGDFLYVLSNNNQVVCYTRQEGYVKWVQKIPLFKDEKNRSGRIIWSGPILADERLIFAGSNGEGLILSAITGEEVGKIKLPGKTLIPPIVADRKLFFLTDSGYLVAFK